MSRITVKSSTVFVSVDKETRVFRSVDEVPPEWRKRFERPRGGLKPQTILIADRKGREEIIRSLEGRPSAVKTRWSAANASGSATGNGPAATLLAPPRGAVARERCQLWDRRMLTIEAGLFALVAFAVCYAFFA